MSFSLPSTFRLRRYLRSASPPVAALLLVLVLVGCTGEPGDGRTDSAPTAESSAPASFAAGDTIVVTGVLFDPTCEVRREKGVDDDCEGKYVRAGYPAGVRTGESPSVWLLMTVPQALADYLSARVKITGVVRSEGVLIPHRIKVRRSSGWATVW